MSEHRGVNANSLPPGWMWVTLGEIAALVRNGVSMAPREERGVPILRISAVRSLVLDISDIRYLPGQISAYAEFELAPGDLLFTRYNGNPDLVGACAVVPAGIHGVVHPDKLIRVRVAGILSGFVAAATVGGRSREHLRQWTRSTAGQAGISGADLKRMPLPIAPVGEQKRIVEALDYYLSRLDAAAAGLKRVEANLKRYRASVLKAAVEGRLVPTEAELAKKEGRSYEPASVLLDRILAERRRRWEESELARMKAKGDTSKNDRWRAKYQEPSEPDAAELPVLPQGWCWVTLDAFLYGIEAGRSFKCEERPPGDGEVGVVKVSAVTWGVYDENESKTCNRTELIDGDLFVREGDLLFSVDFADPGREMASGSVNASSTVQQRES